jgi:hypothetical protein
MISPVARQDWILLKWIISAAIAATMLALFGCTLPIPPTGQHAGRLGSIVVDLTIKYRASDFDFINSFRRANPDIPAPDPKTTGYSK